LPFVCRLLLLLPPNLQVDEPQQPSSLLQGPAVAACLDKHEHKGEDKGLKVMGATWAPAGSTGESRGI
jgi:hypothetical protein